MNQEKSNEFLRSITKGPRLEFLVFEGDNPLGWIRQCDKYFELAKVPEENRSDLAVSYMIGRVDKLAARIWIASQSGYLVHNEVENM